MPGVRAEKRGEMENGFEGGQVQGENAPGPNPAWNDVLSVIPPEYHEKITPHFQQWDQSAQSQIEKANASVKNFEPYQQFVDNGIDATELENGLRLLYEINNNPQNVWDALGKAYGLSGEPGNAGIAQTGAGEEQQQQYQDPRFDQLQQGIELVSQIVLNEQQAKVSAQADAELDRELAELKTKHGDYDERYVLAMMQSGMSGEQAIQSFQGLRNNLLQSNPRPFAPNVMGSSGGGTGYPSQAIDPTKLTPKDTRNLVAQMLAAEYGQRT
jgi:hypothetical protein